MDGIARIETPQLDPTMVKVRDMYYVIEQRARLNGNVEVLMALDRMPNLVLGVTNQVPEGMEAAALAGAYAALQGVVAMLEQAKAVGNQSQSF